MGEVNYLLFFFFFFFFFQSSNLFYSLFLFLIELPLIHFDDISSSCSTKEENEGEVCSIYIYIILMIILAHFPAPLLTSLPLNK